MKIFLCLALLFTLSFSLQNILKGKSFQQLKKSSHSVSGEKPSESKDYWFDQVLDHFDPLSQQVRFRQRFWMNDTYVNQFKDTTLLLAFGGEAPLQDFYGVSDNILADMARENKMMLVYIEHRFYGQSVPHNDSSNRNLKYLTTQQALEDYAYFIKWAKEGGIPKLRNLRKVITFGCSYSGMLSAFFRQKFSWLTVGAIAGSAPVLAKLDFPEYDQTVVSVLASHSPCDINVKVAFETLIKQDISSLKQTFNTCAQAHSVRMVDITSGVGGLIEGAVQGNNPDAGFPVLGLCNAMNDNNTGSPYDRLVSYAKQQLNGDCLDVNSVGDIKVPGAARSWTWQTCIEYGFYQTDVVTGIFGGLIDLQFYIDICHEAFPLPYGTHRANVDLTNYLYGGLNQGQSSWIIFSNGLQDPWGSNLGINKALGPTLPVTLSTSAHCAAYHKPTKNDPSNLIQSRLDIKKFVKEALMDR